jgi:hypothetical protein
MTASFEIILEIVNILYVLKFQIKLVNTYYHIVPKVIKCNHVLWCTLYHIVPKVIKCNHVLWCTLYHIVPKVIKCNHVEIILEIVNILYVLKFQIKLVNTYLVTVNMSWCWCTNFILTTRKPWFRIFIFSSNTLSRKFLFLFFSHFYTLALAAKLNVIMFFDVHYTISCQKLSNVIMFNSYMNHKCILHI